MWLVSDECTRVGRETKRLWNSCQARVLQNGLLTAFSIPLHHSSWTLPLISSPALPIPFLCLLPPPFPALFVAEEDAQSIGGILQTTQPLQPGRTGPLPGSLPPERPRDRKSPGIRARARKKTGVGSSQSVTWMVIPPPFPIELLCRCGLPSKRRCIPFIPQRRRVPLGIVWASPRASSARQGRPGGH